TPALATGGEVPGLATGGTIAGTSLPTTGAGTAQVDGFLGIDGEGMPLVRVDAGEYVTNRKASKEYRTELELINSGKFPKLDNLEQLAAGARKAPGLATGGVVSPDQLLAFAGGKTVNGHTAPGSLEGSPYIWGGGLFSNWGDCSGAMSGLAALAVGVNPAGRKFATMNQGDWLFSHGFRPGLGPADTSFNLGWFNGGPWAVTRQVQSVAPTSRWAAVVVTGRLVALLHHRLMRNSLTMLILLWVSWLLLTAMNVLQILCRLACLHLLVDALLLVVMVCLWAVVVVSVCMTRVAGFSPERSLTTGWARLSR